MKTPLSLRESPVLPDSAQATVLSPSAYWGVCSLAVVGLLLMLAAPADFAGDFLHGRMLSVHLLLELVALVVGSLVVAVSWHQFGHHKAEVSNTQLAGFTVVVVCDLLHALTYEGMPAFITESSTPRAIFYWLMGRTFEVLTLLVIALGLMPRIARGWSLGAGVVVASILTLLGSYALDGFPATFVQGKGVTAFKAGYEYALCAFNIAISVALRRQATRRGDPSYSLLALSAFVMGVGGLAFTAYVAPSDFQNIFGHVYKVVAYALLFRATVVTSMSEPYARLRASEEKLLEARNRITTLGANLPRSVFYQVVEDATGDIRFTEMSQSVERLTGISAEDILNDPQLFYARLAADDLAGLRAARRRAVEANQLFDYTLRVRDAAGNLRWIHLSSAPRKLGNGLTAFDGVMTDVTDRYEASEHRRVLEMQLRQAQKMQSIGTLASGIAHDFNNVLSSIVGNAAMAKADCSRGNFSEVPAAMDQVLKAAQRARNLVRQILTFSRRHPAQTQPQRIHPILVETVSMLQATLPANVSVTIQASDPDLQASIDRTQIGQVLMNLCTNAWQALGSAGGQIELGVDSVVLDASTALAAGVAAGPWVRIWVHDTGCGMDEATQKRVFEPFFTTKPIGEGTGLGMAVVHGIVQNHGGGIRFESTPGVGTRFEVLLPVAKEPGATNGAEASEATPATPGHGEHVLYVDDDEIVSMMVARLLERAGYRVTCCLDPKMALSTLSKSPSRLPASGHRLQHARHVRARLVARSPGHRPVHGTPAVLGLGHRGVVIARP